MSSNDHSEDKRVDGNSGAGTAHAPKLRNGASYALWKSAMDIHLERSGAEGVHTRIMDANKWKTLQAKVKAWKEDKLTALMDKLMGDTVAASASSSSTKSSADSSTPTASASAAASDADKKDMTEMISISTRVYGIIYSALPEELRKQAESIPRGFAYGLWVWLENKFQSTEQDSAAALLSDWIALRQDEGKSFDSYKARVDKLYELMEAAQEPMSKRMYSHALLDRLQPHFKQAVLALKVSEALKVAADVVWADVVRLINNHEREEALGGSGEGVAAITLRRLRRMRSTRRTHRRNRDSGPLDRSARCSASTARNSDTRRGGAPALALLMRMGGRGWNSTTEAAVLGEGDTPSRL